MKNGLKALVALVAGCFALIVVSLTFSMLRFLWTDTQSVRQPHIATVDINGVILTATPLLKSLDEITRSPTAKAIVVRINSPGGLVAPSQEMYAALRRLDEKMPVIVSMSSLAASGGYYAALAGRKLYANSGTLTGSIGVIMQFINTEKLFQWAKVEPHTFKSGKFKDIGNPNRPITPEDRALLTELIQSIYGEFRATVSERRKIADNQLDDIADGRIVTGTQAVKMKLVDALSDYETVIRETKTLVGLKEDAPVISYSPKRGLLRQILDDEKEPEGLFKRFESLLTQLSSPLVLPSGWQLLMLSPAR